MSEAETLEVIRDQLEHDCNETNNHHCSIVTRLKEQPRGNPVLKVYAETDNTGEHGKTSGWSNVVRDMARAEAKHEHLLLGGEPGSLSLIDTGGA